MSSYLKGIKDSIQQNELYQQASEFVSELSEQTTTGRKYAKLEPEKYSQLVYPESILDDKEGMGHYMLININRMVGSKFQDRKDYVENPSEVKTDEGIGIYKRGSSSIRANPYFRNYKRSKESIILQMPEQVGAQYGADWAVTELGSAGTAVSAATAIMNGNFSAKGLFKAAAKSMGETALAATDFITPGNLQDAYQLYMGEQSNPYVEVLFKGSNRRDHPYQFRFTPKNERESQVVREIIRRLKFHMAPELKRGATNSSYLGSPSTFDITFMTRGGPNTWLHKVSTCALASVDVQYQDEKYTVHDDDAPTTITVNCTFVELEVLTKDRFHVGDSY